jgi:hypothetical protein
MFERKFVQHCILKICPIAFRPKRNFKKNCHQVDRLRVGLKRPEDEVDEGDHQQEEGRQRLRLKRRENEIISWGQFCYIF